MSIILELKGVHRTYKTRAGHLPVLVDLNLSLQPGELVGLVGPSGSGKSTLLHAAGLLERPDTGQVIFEGTDCYTLDDAGRTAIRNEKIGFVYQFHHLLPEFNALNNVSMPLLIGGTKRSVAHAKATELLTEMGLTDRIHHQPGQMSGGEQQRVAIARAMANSPRLIIADEPTGNLDPETTERVFGALIRLVKEEGVAVLVATHNFALTKHMDRVLKMSNGKLVPFEIET